ncbi:peroxiredoxin-like family protein [Aquimarina agarivorans]|uniref:peroxiredoxin-like family protein n=1 Tax=Aquimarina agarivorans TaxID=980584 RepID=UPI0002D9D628|nr:peroxiredoxin-like family protein [Aquimarina agarivorans]
MLKPRTKVPDIEVNLVNDTQWELSDQNPKNFTMVIFYRGIHCPVCKIYLEELQQKISKFTERGVNIIAISSDTESTAKETYEKWDIADIPIGFEFPIDKAKDWNLFTSTGIKDEPEMFIEPGLFLIKPDQTLYCCSVQSMPFARPKFNDVLEAIDFVLEEDYPARGEA